MCVYFAIYHYIYSKPYAIKYNEFILYVNNYITDNTGPMFTVYMYPKYQIMNNTQFKTSLHAHFLSISCKSLF